MGKKILILVSMLMILVLAVGVAAVQVVSTDVAKKTDGVSKVVNKATTKNYFNKNAARVYTSCVDKDKGSKAKNTPNLVTTTYTKNGKTFYYVKADKYFYSNGKKILNEQRCNSNFKSGQMKNPIEFVKEDCPKGFKEAKVKSLETGKTYKARACK